MLIRCCLCTLRISEKYFREAATGHVHWRTLVAVADKFLEVGCSLISSLDRTEGAWLWTLRTPVHYAALVHWAPLSFAVIKGYQLSAALDRNKFTNMWWNGILQNLLRIFLHILYGIEHQIHSTFQLFKLCYPLEIIQLLYTLISSPKKFKNYPTQRSFLYWLRSRALNGEGFLL